MHCGTYLSENYAVREGFRKIYICHDEKLFIVHYVMQSCMEVPNPHKGFLHKIPGYGAPSPLPLGLLIKQFITFTASGLFCISHPPSYPPPFMFSPCDLYDSHSVLVNFLFFLVISLLLLFYSCFDKVMYCT